MVEINAAFLDDFSLDEKSVVECIAAANDVERPYRSLCIDPCRHGNTVLVDFIPAQRIIFRLFRVRCRLRLPLILPLLVATLDFGM